MSFHDDTRDGIHQTMFGGLEIKQIVLVLSLYEMAVSTCQIIITVLQKEKWREIAVVKEMEK